MYIYIYVYLYIKWAPHGPSRIQRLSISSAKSPSKKAESTVLVPDQHCRFLKQRAALSKPGWELPAILRSQDLQAICMPSALVLAELQAQAQAG